MCMCWCRIGTVTQVSCIPCTDLRSFSQMFSFPVLCAVFTNFVNVKNGTKRIVKSALGTLNGACHFWADVLILSFPVKQNACMGIRKDRDFFFIFFFLMYCNFPLCSSAVWEVPPSVPPQEVHLLWDRIAVERSKFQMLQMCFWK